MGKRCLLEWCQFVVAIDIDPQKVVMASNNASIYGVEDYIDFIIGDFFQLAPYLKVLSSVFITAANSG
ncbi:hypothetical protein SLEP1_g36081 [Rubroshorea leprosula]|uniref:Trimethylguanosine synthase n=1 Tax=Rubroshorea leprosula TaxID=152421 RepID=A0AAV5KR01_9ROSI|nr:hypothetical protein SLEP1_g36081 [Rubroshorea leprosula]